MDEKCGRMVVGGQNRGSNELALSSVLCVCVAVCICWAPPHRVGCSCAGPFSGLFFSKIATRTFPADLQLPQRLGSCTDTRALRFKGPCSSLSNSLLPFVQHTPSLILILVVFSLSLSFDTARCSRDPVRAPSVSALGYTSTFAVQPTSPSLQLQPKCFEEPHTGAQPHNRTSERFEPLPTAQIISNG